MSPREREMQQTLAYIQGRISNWKFLAGLGCPVAPDNFADVEQAIDATLNPNRAIAEQAAGQKDAA